MKTKVTILGEDKEVKKDLKPIEFVKYMSHYDDMPLMVCNKPPNSYKHIQLIQTGHMYDIMFAYNNSRSEGYLYLGHFNDGVV